MTPYHVLRSVDHARKAIRRGDIVLSERWFKIADKAISIAERLDRWAREQKRHEVPRNPVDYRR